MNSYTEGLVRYPNGMATEVPDAFRRKLLGNMKCYWPRRYVMAFLLFLLLLLEEWRRLSVMYMFAHIIILGEEAHEKYPSIGNWTIVELFHLNTAGLVTNIFVQIPGALLIYVFSSHKYLLFSTVAVSILQMLIPVSMSHHSASFLLLLVTRRCLEAPIKIAIISIWKDWAPPLERTKLMIFSVSGMFVGYSAATFYPYIFHYIISSGSYYLSGISGLVWALLWYNITSETPQNDPLISEQELLYLETTIPSDSQQLPKLKDVPWKSIFYSKQTYILSLIFLKMGCSTIVLVFSGELLGIHLSLEYNVLLLFTPFVIGILIILPCSAILADYLIQKFGGKTLLIRKCFLCGGFGLQCLLLFGTIPESEFLKTVFYMISYTCFMASLPGFYTVVMDLSPRYVAILSGIVFTFHYIGYICVENFVGETVNLSEIHTINWLFLLDGILTALSAIFFGVWGEVEEQLWSLSHASRPTTNDYRSYPKPDDLDD